MQTIVSCQAEQENLPRIMSLPSKGQGSNWRPFQLAMSLHIATRGFPRLRREHISLVECGVIVIEAVAHLEERTLRIRKLLSALGLQQDQAPPPEHAFLALVHRQLKRLGTDRIEYLAAFAGQLARVALVDSVLSKTEEESIVRLLRTRTELERGECQLVVQLMHHEAETLKGKQNHLLNRAFNRHASDQDKEQLVDSLYAVAAADDRVSDEEEQEIRRVAAAVLLPHKSLMEIRSHYREYLEVLDLLPRRSKGAKKA
jgi:uncharacterized tellurite resistance protein B-like protein